MSDKESLHWDAEALWAQLTPLLPGLSVEIVARSDSTNSALLERARAHQEQLRADDAVQVRRSRESAAFGRRAVDVQPCLLVAEQQTGGRGRMGRVWHAAAGSSLTFSISLPMNPPNWSGLSLALGVALAEALESARGTQPPRIGLKWPNDLWLLDAPAPERPPGRKLGGILIETVSAGSCRLAVVGVGLNILPQSMTALSSGYGCVQEIDPDTSAPRVLSQTAAPLVQALRDFNEHGFAPFAARYAARDLLYGRGVTTTQADLPEGVACGVSAHGALLLRSPAGQVREIESGEVSVRLHAGAHGQEDGAC